MIYEMKLEPIPFEATKRGQKTIEVRLCDRKRDAIVAGDKIQFKNTVTEEALTAMVVGVRKYASIEILVQNEQFNMTGGIYKDQSDWVQSIYRYYSKENQAQHGLLALEIKI